jgi:lipoprotein signal peptidase
MDEPWFRRFMIIGYAPIHWKGWVTLFLMLAVLIPSGYMFITSRDDTIWLWAGMTILSGAVGNAVILWRMRERWGNDDQN